MDILKNILPGGGEAGSGLVNSVMGLINSPQIGGLNGLLEKLKQNGLTKQVESWLGKGENLPISGADVQKAVGSEQIDKIAQSTGMSSEQVSAGMADLLPKVVDQMTPDGKVPSGNVLEQGLSMLKGKLGIG